MSGHATIVNARRRAPHPTHVNRRRQVPGPLHPVSAPPASTPLIPPAQFGYTAPSIYCAPPDEIRAAPNAPTQQVTAGEGSTVPIVYGRRRIGGTVAGLGYNGVDAILLVVWCMGEINALEKVQVNDADAPAANPWLTQSFLGTQTQGVASEGTSGFGPTYADKFRALDSDPVKWSVAYTALRVGPGVVSGFPRPTAIVQGRKVKQLQLAYVALNGTSQYASTPSAAANNVDEDFEIAFLGAATDWTPAADKVLLAKWNTTGNQRSWRLLLKTTGALSLELSLDGATTGRTYTSSVATGVTDGARKWVRVRFAKTNSANSTADFALSDDGQAWTALGTQQTGTIVASAIFQSTAAMTLGADSNGAYFAGNVWAARMATAARTPCDLQLYDVADSAAAFTDAAGVAWTLSGGATVNAATGYSVIPINQLCDLATSKIYGAGAAIDVGTALWTYDLNTRQVGSGTTENYNECHLVIDTMSPVDSWITTLADYANCFPIRDAGNKYYFIRDWKDGATAAFDANTIEQGSFTLRKRGAQDQPNCIEVTYTDTSKTPWADERVTVYRAGVLNGTLPRRMARYQKQGLTRYSEAYRYAVGRLNLATLNDTEVEFNAFDDGNRVRQADIISVSYPYSAGNGANTIDQKAYRVTNVQPTSPGYYRITAQEHNVERYDETVIQSPIPNDSILPSPNSPPAVTGLAATEDVYQVATGLFGSRLKVSWTAPAFPFVDVYTVEVRQNSDAGTLVDSGMVPPISSPNWVSQQLVEQDAAGNLITYVVLVKVRSVTGVTGTAATITRQLTGKQAKPGDIGSVTGFEVGGEVRLTWSSTRSDGTPIDLDWAATEIRYGTTAGSWGTATLVNRVAAPGVFYATKNVPPSAANPGGVWRFYVKALDSVRSLAYPFGQESVNAVSVDVTVTSDAGAFVAVDYSYATPSLYKMSQQVQGGAIFWVSDSGGTWNAAFGSNLNTYGSILDTYFAPAKSALLTEVKDHGASVTGDWAASIDTADLAGAANKFLDLNNTGAEGSKTITGATSATPIVITTSAAHGYANGDEVEQSGFSTNTTANGRFIVANVGGGGTTYELTDFAGNNVGPGNGSVTGTPIAKRWAWFPYPSLSARTVARYSRMRVWTAGVVKATSLGRIRASVVARHEGGQVTTLTGSAPAVVTFANVYNKAVAASATPVGAAVGALTDTCAVDLIEVSGGRGVIQSGANYLLRFNGSSDYVAVGDNAAFEFGGGADTAFSIEFWLKLATIGAAQCCVAKGTGATPAGSYEVRVGAAGKVQFILIDQTASASVNCATSTLLVPDLWYHVACTYSGSNPTTAGNMLVYINGVPDVTTLILTGTYTRMRDTASPLEFGRRGAADAYLNGRLDEVRIWSVAQSAANIVANMNAALTSGTGLVGRWGFDEGSGTTAVDSVAARNGTLTGGPPKYRPYNGMDVYRFNAAGAQVADLAAWSFDGV